MIIFTLLTTIGKKSTPGKPEDETELIRRIRSRDADALEELYELYKRLLLGMVLPIVKKRETAEDILQEIFIYIWNNADTFNEEHGNVYSWIVAMSRNRAIDHMRSKNNKGREKASESMHEPFSVQNIDQYDPLGTTIFSNRSELVKKALQEIPETQRQVIRIAFSRGMTQVQIAEHLDIPLSTVKARTREAMITLKRILHEFIN